MKDLNQIPVSRLPQGKSRMRPGSPAQSIKSFLEDWPTPPKCTDDSSLGDGPNSFEVKRWRLQILLAVNPYGIPSTQFSEAYTRMFSKKFELHDFGFDNLNELISSMPDIFAVQQPDETTALLFPDYLGDKILHDARLGNNFAKPAIDRSESLMKPTARIQAHGTKEDFEDLIMRAWMNRDEEFPPDVVLAGESYDQLLKISLASVPGTMGLYQATMISAASPDSMFIRLKTKTSEADLKRIAGLSNEIKEYFKESSHSIDAYSVPKEFLLPGFPCLVYSSKEQSWERCTIVGRSTEDNKVLVESIDFGGAYSVHTIFLYLIPRQFLDIPRQTLQVSLMGIKPAESDGRWKQKTGSRLRCFSFERYHLDVLLIGPRMQRYAVSRAASPQPEAKPSEKHASSSNDSPKSSARHRFHSRMSYEALIVDRNDDEMDIYLDEILKLETYAVEESSRVEEVEKTKGLLREVLKDIPRPKNPFE